MKVIKGRYQNIFGEWRDIEVKYKKIREVSSEELIERARIKGMFYPTIPKPSIIYDVWINGKKITRGNKKFIKELGLNPEIHDFLNMDYVTKIEKLEEYEVKNKNFPIRKLKKKR